MPRQKKLKKRADGRYCAYYKNKPFYSYDPDEAVRLRDAYKYRCEHDIDEIRKIAVKVKFEIRIVRSRIEHCGCEHHLFMHPHRPIYFRVIAARDLADFVCHDSRLHNQTLSLSDRMRSVDDFSAYATVLIRYARQEIGISVRFVYHRKLTAPWHSGNVSATSRRKIKPSICRHDTICKNTEAFNPKIGNLSSFTEIIRMI